LVVKAQVKTGGRGKAGGVKRAKDPAELRTSAEAIFGMTIKGHKVEKIIVVPAAEIVAEFYASISFDRGERNYILMFSLDGGVEIEKLAVDSPEKLIKQHFSAITGLTDAVIDTVLKRVESQFDVKKNSEKIISEIRNTLNSMWKCYVKNDATLVEINPLSVVNNGGTLEVQALDAKISLDDNAKFRHLDLFNKYADNSSRNPFEVQAAEAGIHYVHLDGEVGIIGNGAGLVMSTLDVVALKGRAFQKENPPRPANFLDIGGGASAEMMKKSLDLVLSDRKVRSVFINVFGGLTRCDLVAEGLLEALKNTGNDDSGRKDIPIVVRFAGNGALEGLKILEDAKNANIYVADDMDDAALKAVMLAVSANLNENLNFKKKSDSGVGSGNDFAKKVAANTKKNGDGGILISKNSQVIVQGITGSEGWRHTLRMLNAGTNIVGGVNPKKAGTQLPVNLDDGTLRVLPVFGTVQEARKDVNADVSIIFVPPAFAKAAVEEAVLADIPLIVVITEGIPIFDSTFFVALANSRPNIRIVGPNCPGLATIGASNVGIIPDGITNPGPIGLVSKSGTLTYQLMNDLANFGFTTAVGIGGDPAIGTTHIDALAMFEADPSTRLIVMIGEIGGNAEELAAEYIKNHISKPVVAYIAGFEAPEGKTMGHAGAIISGSLGTAESKKRALEAAGVKVGKTPSETALIVSEYLARMMSIPI
jgi:succinyl-CoA synthetase alpha subunit